MSTSEIATKLDRYLVILDGVNAKLDRSIAELRDLKKVAFANNADIAFKSFDIIIKKRRYEHEPHKS